MNNEIIETPSIEGGKSKKQKTIIITSVILSFLLILGIVLGLVFGLKSNHPGPKYHEKEIGNGDQIFTQAKKISNIDKSFNKYGFKNGIANFDNVNIEKTFFDDNENGTNEFFVKPVKKVNLNIGHLKIIVQQKNNNIKNGVSVELWNFNLQKEKIINSYSTSPERTLYYKSFSFEGEYLFLEQLTNFNETEYNGEGLRNVYGKNLKYTYTYMYGETDFEDDDWWLISPIDKEIYTCDIFDATNFIFFRENGENYLSVHTIFIQIENLSIQSSLLPFAATLPINLEFKFHEMVIQHIEYYQVFWNIFKFTKEWHFYYI